MTDKPTCSPEARRYTELPPKTREFIENLRDDDVALLQDGIRLVLAFRTVSSFTKWVIIGIVGAFIASVTLAESVMKVVAWFKGAK